VEILILSLLIVSNFFILFYIENIIPIKGYKMKYWNRALKELEGSDLSFNAIYETVFSFGENVFYEKIEGNNIVKTTYSRCNELIKIAAKNIQTQLCGFDKNSFVAIKMENCGEWIISFWAILMAGFCPVLVNTRSDENYIISLLDSLKIAAVISDFPFKNYNYINSSDMCVEKENGELIPNWANQIVLSTSGTSGQPKTCLYDGEAISSQIFNSKYVLRKNSTIKTYYKGQIKLLAFLPFYHIFGLIANLLWFSFFGRTFVFLKDMDPETILSTCKRHGVTHVFAIPLLWNSVATTVRKKAMNQGEQIAKKLEKGLTISIWLQSVFPRLGKLIVNHILFKNVRRKIFGDSVTFCISGGSYIKDDTLRVLNGLGYSLYNGYGMTETGITSVELRLKASKRILGAVGRPFPSAEYRIENGELLVRGKSLFLAYIENGKMIYRDKESWFPTKDAADYHKSGNYFLKGRIDDLIINEDGENLSPDILESFFDLNHVKRVCVLGLSGKNNIFDISLVIEPIDNASELHIKKILISANEINNRLSLNQKIRRTFIAGESLPVVLESKIRRVVLKNLIENKQIKITEVNLSDYSDRIKLLTEEENEILIFVKRTIADVLEINVNQITESSHFLYDLNGNSFSYFALLSRLEKEYDINFNITRENMCEVPTDFVKYIINA